MLKFLSNILHRSNTVKVTCLGGTGEIGMNLYIYETEEHAIVVDYGVMFADSSMPGIDSILPDPAYLEAIKEKVRGVFFTHGHEDHIGGVVEAVNRVQVPVYTGRFTAELVKNKTERAGVHIDLHVVQDSDIIKCGDFEVRFIGVPHSIPDTFALHISCRSFTAIHASDFRTDGSIEEIAGRFRVAVGSGNTPLCLFLDSTNAGSHKENRSEEEVFDELVKIFAAVKGRIFFTTFASNVKRLSSAVEAAKLTGRKVVLEGAAIERTLGIAARLGLVSLPEGVLLTTKQAYREEADKLVYLVSGCQGEFTSALYSIAMGERKAVHMVENDMLIFSSRSIPGNEGGINAMINSAMRRGVDVVQASDCTVHVSGHITPSEIVSLVSEVRPHYFIPIHGEYRHLRKNIRLAESAGMEKNNCLILETGRQLIFEKGKYKGESDVPSGRIYVDFSGGFVLDDAGLAERRQIARDGVVVVLSTDGSLEVKTYGFSLDATQGRGIMSALENRRQDYPEEGLTDAERIKKAVKRFFRKHLDRRPLIDVVELKN